MPSGEVRERRGGGEDGGDRVGAKSGGFLARGDDGREYDQEDGADGDHFGGFRNGSGMRTTGSDLRSPPIGTTPISKIFYR